MKPTIKLAETTTPDGATITLSQHDKDFSIAIDCRELMNSRRHESELELARLGCAHLEGKPEPKVLIGGLGLGYTLRQTLDLLPDDGVALVGELLPAIVSWNREFLGELNGNPLDDSRTEVKEGDVFKLISKVERAYDAILLDVDNGPDAMTHAENRRLYSRGGIYACRNALRDKGCLAIWSSEPDKRFEELLLSCGFFVSRFRVPAYKGSKTQSHFIWVASLRKSNIPSGGSEPRAPITEKPKGRGKPEGRDGNRRNFRRSRRR